MVVYKIYVLCLLLLFTFSSHADQSTAADNVGARIAELSAMSVRSVSGNFIIIGTNRIESFALGSWCENALKQIEKITGLPVPFIDNRISLIIDESNNELPSGVAVRYSKRGQNLTSRVYLKNYEVAYELRGRQASCCAILSKYLDGESSTPFTVPPWLWKGIEQNVLSDARSRNMEIVLSDWRLGRLMTVWDIVGREDINKADDRVEDAEVQSSLATYSVFVSWISSQANRKDIFRSIFNHSEYITVKELESLVVGNNSDLSLDEAWERWLLRQSNVVRSNAPVSRRMIEQLRSELLLYPGACGIPLKSEIEQGFTFANLLTFREAEWMPQYVNRKRGRLNLIVAGHSGSLVDVVALYNDYLSGLEKDIPDILLLKTLNSANKALGKLAQQVNDGGGILKSAN